MTRALRPLSAPSCEPLGAGAAGRGQADAFASAPQIADSCVEGGAGEVAAGHDASLADGSPAVTANAVGGFA